MTFLYISFTNWRQKWWWLRCVLSCPNKYSPQDISQNYILKCLCIFSFKLVHFEFLQTLKLHIMWYQPCPRLTFTRMTWAGLVNFGLAFGKYDITWEIKATCQNFIFKLKFLFQLDYCTWIETWNFASYFIILIYQTSNNFTCQKESTGICWHLHI